MITLFAKIEDIAPAKPNFFDRVDVETNLLPTEDPTSILEYNDIEEKEVEKPVVTVTPVKAFKRTQTSEVLPSTDLLNNPKVQIETISAQSIDFVSRSIENKLAEFGVEASITNAETGPVITRYELLPSRGVRGDKIVSLGKEIARGLALTNVRIVETIPGKNSMGIEVPNFKRQINLFKRNF